MINTVGLCSQQVKLYQSTIEVGTLHHVHGPLRWILPSKVTLILISAPNLTDKGSLLTKFVQQNILDQAHATYLILPVGPSARPLLRLVPEPVMAYAFWERDRSRDAAVYHVQSAFFVLQPTQTPTQTISDFLPTFRLTIDAERTTAIMPRDVKAYLASKKSETSDLELAQEWAEIEELYSKRYFCGVFLYT